MSDIDHHAWAEVIMVYLIDRIRNFQGGDKYIFYKSLAEVVGYPEPHTWPRFNSNIGDTLGVMGHMFDDILIDGEVVPYLQVLIVNQDKKLPGKGIKEFYPDYPSYSPQEKQKVVREEIEKIERFGNRWEKLLDQLGIDYDFHLNEDEPDIQSQRHNPYGNEGSPEHRGLRDYIANNPAVVGIEEDVVGLTEYPLKSGDQVDVLFQLEGATIGVEVKSWRSGLDDIERGIFQCIKYSAVLEAENIINGNDVPVQCILVVESGDPFPRRISSTQKKLEVTIIQGISPQ